MDRVFRAVVEELVVAVFRFAVSLDIIQNEKRSFDPCLRKKSSSHGKTPCIPFSQKIPRKNKPQREHLAWW